MAIKKDYLVEKKNVLNDMRCTNMTLTELRFFTIYLAKINARDPSTKTVRFPLSEFLKIMEIRQLKKVNVSAVKDTMNRLVSRIVNLPLPSGGRTAFALFSKCKVDKGEDESWYFEIVAHEDALPLMFEFKRDYFKYELWNALRLSSSNQIRMYEILKEYEYRGERTVNLDELKGLLGIEKNSYPYFADFRKQVLDKAQTALLETTDICFTYEPIKKGQAGKVVSIRFTIKKNENYIDQLTLSEFIDLQESCDLPDGDIGEQLAGDDIAGEYWSKDSKVVTVGVDFEMLSEAFNNEFSLEEVEHLYFLSLPYVQFHNPDLTTAALILKMHDYFTLKYSQLKVKAKTVKSSRYGLLRSFIEADVRTVNT
jgi:hypothetical protein